MRRHIPSDALEPTNGVEVVRIGIDGEVAVERLSGRTLRGRRPRLSFPGLVVLYTGYLFLMAVGTIIVARFHGLPLPTLDPELYDLTQRYLRSPAVIWLGYGVSPTAMLGCLFLSGVDMRRDQSFWIFFFITLCSIVVATWKAVLPKHWLGIPIFSFFLWIVVYGESACLAARLRRRLARGRL